MLVLRGEGGSASRMKKPGQKKLKKPRTCPDRWEGGGTCPHFATVHCAKLPIVAREGDDPRWHRRFLPLDTAGRHVLNARKTRRHEAPPPSQKNQSENVFFFENIVK